eukprot:gnl/MRDRNA2_/MRDRNA2_119479_c0_seq1.p1 gnl/MRDRNA2_/MRDRNA2_119479_c0~~gnl/MRDRNA2_/MRDRNA2_119479_c0_seq1.p1  ORF type:complete len:296 (-),score=50.43 gnl/MRDRNA2_/MRDRNA2_119479_c0_seq1:68-955(-)
MKILKVMVHRGIAIFLCALTVQGSAAKPVSETNHLHSSMDTLTDKLVSKFIDRLLKMSLVHNVEADDTTLARIGPLASPQKALLPAFTSRSSVVHLPFRNAISDPIRTPRKAPVLRAEEDDGSPTALKNWPATHDKLRERGLYPISGVQAQKMVEEKGAVLVDVRLTGDYETETIEGAVHVPLMKKMEWNWKRALGNVVGVDPNEANPDFTKQAREALPSDKPLIIVCEKGGSLKPIVGAGEMERSQYTMSLKAAWELYEAGFKDVYIMDGGIDRWPGNWVYDPLDKLPDGPPGR